MMTWWKLVGLTVRVSYVATAVPLMRRVMVLALLTKVALVAVMYTE
jgi:hypothetical protein